MIFGVLVWLEVKNYELLVIFFQVLKHFAFPIDVVLFFAEWKLHSCQEVCLHSYCQMLDDFSRLFLGYQFFFSRATMK